MKKNKNCHFALFCCHHGATSAVVSKQLQDNNYDTCCSIFTTGRITWITVNLVHLNNQVQFNTRAKNKFLSV